MDKTFMIFGAITYIGMLVALCLTYANELGWVEIPLETIRAVYTVAFIWAFALTSCLIISDTIIYIWRFFR